MPGPLPAAEGCSRHFFRVACRLADDIARLPVVSISALVERARWQRRWRRRSARHKIREGLAPARASSMLARRADRRLATLRSMHVERRVEENRGSGSSTCMLDMPRSARIAWRGGPPGRGPVRRVAWCKARRMSDFRQAALRTAGRCSASTSRPMRRPEGPRRRATRPRVTAEAEGAVDGDRAGCLQHLQDLGWEDRAVLTGRGGAAPGFHLQSNVLRQHAW